MAADNPTLTSDDWKAYVGDVAARAADEERRAALMAQLAQAERLLFDEGYTTDDPWPGIVYKPGHVGSERRVDIDTWVMMRALVRGMGEAILRQDAKRQAR
jgi:hypothetical protein